MKIENLYVGQRVANYKKLCEVLEEPVKNGGTAKTAQIKNWEQWFSFERDKNAFIITEVFDTPTVSKDGRKKFIQYVEPLLLNYLWREYENWGTLEVEQTTQKWSVEIGLSSGRVYDDDIKDEWIQLAPHGGGFSPLVVQRTAYELAQRCKEVIYSTAESLEKRGIVKVEKRMYVIKNSAHKLATSDEVRAAERARERALDELGCTYFSMSMSREKRRRYTTTLARIFKEEYGWSNVYMLLAIKLNRVEDGAAYQSADLDGLKNSVQQEIKRNIDNKLNNEVRKGVAKEEAAWDNDELGAGGYSLSTMDKDAMMFLLDDLI